MDFTVVAPRDQHPRLSPPYAVLQEDNWNDYGFHTLFRLYVYPAADAARIEVGHVKVARFGQPTGEHRVPPEFESLDKDYISLGQDAAYYEVLMTLSPPLRNDVLSALRDAVWMPQLVRRFRDQQVWRISMIRFGEARRVLDTAKSMLLGEEVAATAPPSVTFTTAVGGTTFQLDFLFSDPRLHTSNICALIGYNGTGKTTVLSKLARAAHADRIQRAEEGFRHDVGYFAGLDPDFSSVIMVSYSAFDSFLLPGWEGGESRRKAQQNEGEVFGYSYCGLRIPGSDAVDRPGGETSLKSPERLAAEFAATTYAIRRVGRDAVLRRTLQHLALEPSFAGSGLIGVTDADVGNLEELFNTLSSGHKIVLSVMTHLIRRLQRGSLVLIDEPEAHLHPSLLAAVLTSLSDLLTAYDSVAVVATHSPVLLQELPSVNVSVLRRSLSETVVAKPDIETFGENVGLITSHVFHLDGADTDHHDILRAYARSYPLEVVEGFFLHGLSAAARSYFLSQQHRDSDA